MVKKSILDTASRYVKQLPTELDVRKAYLFGSSAKGLDKEDSDIDIAVIVGNMPDFFATQIFHDIRLALFSNKGKKTAPNIHPTQ